MTRGDIIVTSSPSASNVLILQQPVDENSETVVVASIRSDLSGQNPLRVPIQPTAENGLRESSQIMIDNLQTVLLSRIVGVIGRASPEVMRNVDAALRIFLQLP